MPILALRLSLKSRFNHHAVQRIADEVVLVETHEQTYFSFLPLSVVDSPRFIMCLASCDRRTGSKPSKEEVILEALQKLKTGTEKEQETASHRLWDIARTVRFEGFGTLDPKEIISAIAEFATQSPSDYVRTYTINALGEMRNELAVPALIQGLSDKWKPVVQNAYSGLHNLGPKAKAAVPALTEGILNDSLPADAVSALVAIQGKDAIPTLLKAAQRPNAKRELISRTAHALTEYPDWQAADFMENGLRDGAIPAYSAAAFYGKFNNPIATTRLRQLLAQSIAASADDRERAGENAPPSYTRQLAVTALGARRDKASFEKIRQLLVSDPHLFVRWAAAKALGEYGNPAAINALRATLHNPDPVFLPVEMSSDVLFEVRRAAVSSLAKINTVEALRAIYDGLFVEEEKPNRELDSTRRACREFWQRTGELQHLNWFLKFHSEKPVKAEVMADIVNMLLYRNRDKLTLPAKDLNANTQKFLATVVDAKHFGTDISDSGRYDVRRQFVFYRNGLTLVSFVFSSVNARGFGHGYSVLYRKNGKHWLPIAKTNGWVS